MIEPYYERDGISIYCGDCREVCVVLSGVDSVVTDPPYGLEFMGKEWDHGVPGENFWRVFSGVCKPGAMCLAFGGTRKFHRLACAIEDAGWEIRDCINWIYGSGFPKSLDISKAIDKAAGAERVVIGTARGKGGENLNQLAREGGNDSGDARSRGCYGHGAKQTDIDIPITAPSTDAAKQWQGWGTALKPAWEPIVVAMKPLDGTFAQNALKHGVAGLNIDGCRVEGAPAPTRFDPAKHGHEGWRMNATGAECAANASPLGRWPANLIHDGSEEVLAGFPQQTSGANPTRRGSPKFRNAYGAFEGQEECVAARGSERGSAARFFYCAKASKKDRGDGNTHPTVKPHELMKYLLQLVSTPTGGIVLDPFMGSGSTLVAAKALGRRAIGIELNKEYCDIAIARLAE